LKPSRSTNTLSERLTDKKRASTAMNSFQGSSCFSPALRRAFHSFSLLFSMQIRALIVDPWPKKKSARNFDERTIENENR
jgi:hypothetical protein